MKKINCIHYNICVVSDEHVCSDPKCPLNRIIIKKENEERLEAVRKAIDELWRKT